MRKLFMKYDEVTPILEEDHGFQLILHQRDFMPGAAITTNIADAVEKSRRMIMLLSRYCQFLRQSNLLTILTPHCPNGMC